MKQIPDQLDATCKEKIPILKLLKMLCKYPPNQDFFQKKIIGTGNNKVHTEWDMASWVSLLADTYSVSLLGLLAVLSHCLEKFSKMENEKFCLKEKSKKKKEAVSVWSLN